MCIFGCQSSIILNTFCEIYKLKIKYIHYFLITSSLARVKIDVLFGVINNHLIMAILEYTSLLKGSQVLVRQYEYNSTLIVSSFFGVINNHLIMAILEYTSLLKGSQVLVRQYEYNSTLIVSS